MRLSFLQGTRQILTGMRRVCSPSRLGHAASCNNQGPWIDVLAPVHKGIRATAADENDQTFLAEINASLGRDVSGASALRLLHIRRPGLVQAAWDATDRFDPARRQTAQLSPSVRAKSKGVGK
jgi:hypothetical protein